MIDDSEVPRPTVNGVSSDGEDVGEHQRVESGFFADQDRSISCVRQYSGVRVAVAVPIRQRSGRIDVVDADEIAGQNVHTLTTEVAHVYLTHNKTMFGDATLRWPT